MRLDLSIVVPLLDEEDNVRPLYRALEDFLKTSGKTYEIIFVDDGSRDDTLRRLRALQSRNSAVRILHFRRNFGQTPATRVGVQAARGDVVVTLDGDLQNDPNDIPALLREIEAGHDLVVGWRRDRKDSALLRTFPSRVANWMIGKITGVRIHDSGCSLKAYRREMIQRVPLYSEMHRFIPAMSRLQSARISEVVVRHHPRTRGESKYGLSRIGKVLLDVVAIKMLISFGRQPMYWFCLLSLPFLLLSTTAAVAYLALALGSGGAGLVSPAAFLLFAYLAVHFVLVGLLAEIVIRSSKGRQDTTHHARILDVAPRR